MDGIDGMETARRLRNRNFRGYLIFITVLREMVFEAFSVQPYDYLLKTMKEEAFVKTMERLFASMQEERAASLLVQRGYESSLVPFGDIIFCEIIDRKIYLHLKTGEVIDYYDRLERLETKLDSRFYKCHRSYLINLNYLKSYKNGMAYMISDKAIPVSRLREKKRLEQQIKAAAGEEEKVKEWKKKLAQVEEELSWKDNDTYRRQNSVTY